MNSSPSGTLRLFRFAGIQVFLHWTWFFVPAYEVMSRAYKYDSIAWNIAECIALFAIVTLHEFGHALACRQVGGQAHHIILWPLGGIAFVSPPPRPGATLWSIAAGPLVNVALVPVLLVAAILTRWLDPGSDASLFVSSVAWTNFALLVFNLLPVYPLDGGQILRSLLWFKFGRGRSLKLASYFALGAIAVVAVIVLTYFSPNGWMWPAIMLFYLGQQCMIGLREAKFLSAIEQLPKHPEFACPTCHALPPGGPIWVCGSCHRAFDPFSTDAVCPHCRAVQSQTRCINCGAAHPISEWRRPEPPIVDLPPDPV